MAVVRPWRGRGVGTALMVAAIDWAREQGLHKLSLNVFAHNVAAIALYRKFGFTALSRPERIMEITDPDVYLRSKQEKQVE